MNSLLASLLRDHDRGLRPHLRTVALSPRQILHRQGEPIALVYFPNGGVISAASALDDGSMVEAGTIGDEGFVGVEAVFRERPVSSCETIVQVPTRDETAYVMTIADFRRHLACGGPFSDAIGRYASVFYTVMARLTACNATHTVRRRCARWLLTTHDRMRGGDFHLSHESLAVMLGVRRPTVSVVAQKLQSAGLIHYVHGNVTVVDRSGLEAMACPCYAAIRSQFASLAE